MGIPLAVRHQTKIGPRRIFVRCRISFVRSFRLLKRRTQIVWSLSFLVFFYLVTFIDYLRWKVARRAYVCVMLPKIYVPMVCASLKSGLLKAYRPYAHPSSVYQYVCALMYVDSQNFFSCWLLFIHVHSSVMRRPIQLHLSSRNNPYNI